MINCPACQSPNAASAKTFIERAMNVAQAIQALGIKRLSAIAELSARGAGVIGNLLRDFRCVDCGHRFDA